MAANNVGPLLLLIVFTDKNIFNREFGAGQMLLQRNLCFLLYPHQLVPNRNNNSAQTVLETHNFYFLHSVVIQHDIEACSMHRKLPKTPKLLLKTNRFIRQRQQWLEHCLFLVIMSLGGEKNRTQQVSSFNSLFLFTDETWKD